MAPKILSFHVDEIGLPSCREASVPHARVGVDRTGKLDDLGNGDISVMCVDEADSNPGVASKGTMNLKD